MSNIIELLNEILETLKKEKIQKATLNIREAAIYLGIGHEKIRELVEKQNTDFPYFKVGTRTSIDRKALDIWVDKITEEHREL